MTSLIYDQQKEIIQKIAIDSNLLYNPIQQNNQNNINGLFFFNATLLVEYINLNVDERRRFAQVDHEYLIEELELNI